MAKKKKIDDTNDEFDAWEHQEEDSGYYEDQPNENDDIFKSDDEWLEEENFEEFDGDDFYNEDYLNNEDTGY